jgi:hypothetical protein
MILRAWRDMDAMHPVAKAVLQPISSRPRQVASGSPSLASTG